MKVLLCLSALVAVALSQSTNVRADGKTIVCYWGTWSHYRPGNGKFSIENIDPFLCTHYMYAFAVLKNGEIASHDPWLDEETSNGLGMYLKFTALKQRNPLLKTLIAIGGWNEGSRKYSEMAETAYGRRKFIDSVVRFIQRYGFDGLDMDWEYPAARGGRPQDKANHALLLKELREEFDNYGYLLTAAVAAGKETIDVAYDVASVSKYLHFMNVMCYDYFGAWGNTTGHNSPITARPDGSELEQIFNMEYSLNYWMSKGADPKKMILGLPLYGRTFTLENANVNHIGAPALGPGSGGPFTREPGYLAYNEICVNLNSWTILPQNEHIGAPIAVKGREWVGFDDAQSLQKKVKFGQSMKLGGVMVWAIDVDDFRGLCHAQSFPLLKAVKAQIESGGEIDPTSRPTPSTSTQRPPSTPSGPFKCTQVGYFPHPTDSSKFFKCTQGVNGEFIANEFTCPVGTEFDPHFNTCVHKRTL